MIRHSGIKICLFSALGALALVSCSNPKEKLGLSKSAPDEFAVIKRAPLEIPADFSALPAPRPGASRPQELNPGVEAQQAVFGRKSKEERKVSEGESSLLGQTGAMNADPEIRRKIDQEAAEQAASQRPVADRLLNWTSSKPKEAPAAVVNPEKEAERLKRNMDLGKPVTDGETPSEKQ